MELEVGVCQCVISSNVNSFFSDWSRVPSELKPQKRKVKASVKSRSKETGMEQKIDLAKALDVSLYSHSIV